MSPESTEINESEVIGTCADCNKNHLPVYSTLNKFVCSGCFQSESNQNQRLIVSKEIQTVARANDAAINTRTDLFNAGTTAIIELKDAIEADVDILNKPYALASQLMDRFNHFKKVIFDMNEAAVVAGNHQRAIQVYLNQLANSLRQEEREKLRLNDITYKPEVIKPIKPKAIKTAKGKLNKDDLKKFAAELKIPESTLQMICVAKGLTVESAANMLRKSIAEAKSESTSN